MANLVAADYNDTLQQIFDKNFRSQPVVQIKRFNNWPVAAGILLASLVVSSTASRTNGIVTVSATGHGITTGSTYVGFRFFYPGSPSLAAGLYDSILTIPDANTLTFSAPGADFGSESVNAGAAYTTATDLISMIIPGGTLRDQSKLSLCTLRTGSTAAINKTITLLFGGSNVNNATTNTSPGGELKQGFRCLGTNKQIAIATYEGGVTASGIGTITKDITADQTLTIRGTVAAAGDYLAIWGATVEITP